MSGPTVDAEGYLVVSPSWHRSATRPNGDRILTEVRLDRLTKGRPANVRGDEVVVRVKVRLPEAVFRRPRFDVTVDVPEELVTDPEPIIVTIEGAERGPDRIEEVPSS